MQSTRKPTVAVLFGGRSVEHEVSIITGHQIAEALEVAGYSLLPIYVTKEGEWYAGSSLYNVKQYGDPSFHPDKLQDAHRVSLSPDRSVRQLLPHPDSSKGLFKKSPRLWADVFFPAIHGSFGEDGSLQGLFEMADVAYVGSGVLGSAMGMDKVRMKALFRDSGIPVLSCLSISQEEWKTEDQSFIAKVESTYSYPVIVKPASLGSSIGVKRCEDASSLNDAIEVALRLDERALVERALVDFIEINCSVMGSPEKASVCEQPCPSEAVLTFDAKYKRGRKGAKTGNAEGGMASLDRIIPAPIPDSLTLRIQQLSVQAFRLVGASGVARLDFLLEKNEGNLFLNEINTMPGSVAFYLWEASGVPFDELVTQCVNMALDRQRVRARTSFSFETNLLRR
ncbi:MAG: D-alanine--D-alanine ligase family protein [Acidobacteriota bacterium]